MREIRRISPSDWQVWRDVRLEALTEAPYAFGATLASWVDAEEARWRQRLEDEPCNVVAFADDAPVGQASGTHVDGNGAVELISMWVAPAARGTGVAEELIAAVVDSAVSQGARRVDLAVKRTNARAIALYERAGFVLTGEPANEPDELRMARSCQEGSEA